VEIPSQIWVRQRFLLKGINDTKWKGALDELELKTFV
jgi:hypothetical protein